LLLARLPYPRGSVCGSMKLQRGWRPRTNGSHEATLEALFSFFPQRSGRGSRPERCGENAKRACNSTMKTATGARHELQKAGANFPGRPLRVGIPVEPDYVRESPVYAFPQLAALILYGRVPPCDQYGSVVRAVHRVGPAPCGRYPGRLVYPPAGNVQGGVHRHPEAHSSHRWRSWWYRDYFCGGLLWAPHGGQPHITPIQRLEMVLGGAQNRPILTTEWRTGMFGSAPRSSCPCQKGSNSNHKLLHSISS